MQTILVVDDERSVREAHRQVLSDRYRILQADDGAAAIKTLESTHVDLVVLDLIMPHMGGLEVLDALQRAGSSVPVIVVTAHKAVSTAVDAMKRGAREYIIKPFDVDELLLTVERTLAEDKQRRELSAIREAEALGFESLIGDSRALKEAVALAKRATQVDSTVLVTGESGTGKDLLVRCIHSAGRRARGPFVVVSCCAIPEQLVESELFGHEKGAFTGAVARRDGKVQVADRGTLFLDEIGEMPLDAQAKLLRVLQEGQFYPVGSTKVIEADVRFICATNRDLKREVERGTFRQDLYYRVNVIPIEMPPLRNRREDIPLLVGHFLAKHAPHVNSRAEEFGKGALERLAAYSWPGNVRELENLVERVLVHHSDERVIREEHLCNVLPAESTEGGPSLGAFEGMTLDAATAQLEKHLITRALDRCGHVQSRAAEMLGTTRRILKYKMDQLGIHGPNGDEEDA